ncbi:MAG: hypothetical protein MUP36_03275 [Demequinaceae bacterium]|nr:hypothetical protein [Demequinaceae bacterium]
MPRIRGDRGSVSLVAIGIVAVTATLVVALGAAGAVSAAAARAQGAADASALAVASEVRDLRALGGISEENPCDEAVAVVGEWGVTLENCSVERGGAVTVTVGTRAAGISISRLARAGTD